MSIETTPSTQADPAWEKVIKGQLATTAEDDEDIAPGVIEVVPNRAPAVYRAGSAAMVVAAKTGRAVGLVARPLCVGLQWFGSGVKATSVLGWRYVRAHDHQEVLGGMSSDTDWNKVERTRVKRWKILGWTTLAAATLNATGWTALVTAADMSVLEATATLPGGEAAVVGAALTLYGRYRINHPGMPAGQILADEDREDDDPDEPFPLAWCTDGEQVEECVSRALYAEGIATRSIRLLGSHPWAREIDIMLKGATPGKVAAVADQLDVHFNIKHGGTLIEPDVQESAHITLRLVTANPFADMPKPTVHAPNSLDIADAHNLGRCMDSSQLNVVLQGLRILVIGVSGSAKTTGVLRDLAEIITACHNAIALDLDPVKDGLREFEDVMAVPPIRGNEACEEWLGYLVRMAEARNVVRNRLKMGDTWQATWEHPDIFPCVDEFIYLSQKAKELFIRLCRLGKQVGIYPIAAGQDATSDAMGDAIADSFTFRVMLASRWDDIRIVFGKGAAAEGYRPDRLVPAQNKDIKNDAGQSYIKGAGITRPLLYGWNEHSREAIERAVEERGKAGRPWFDHDTLAEADLLHLASEYGPAGQMTLAERLAQLDHSDAELVAVLLRAFESKRRDFLPTTEVLLPVLEAAGIEDVDSVALAKRLRSHAPGATADRTDCPEGKHLRGWHRAVVERAAGGLLDPAKTRQNPGVQAA
ncbi:hypothetical protein [Streptomyces sp. WAC05858]|uniref:hypothetical protein n=1 Tax=Streptomyces TaxID=1883 RepID=UPI000F77C9B5|nr:hypothetical protein [Streptomyces sp. WAC05858]RSS34689.1 hypothetical protein EF902_40035 [Streptomyces sp. WAC05858]